MENKKLQDEIETLKTNKTQLAFRLNEVEREKDQEKKKSMKEVSSLKCEKNSLIEKVAALEVTISKNLEKDEKNGKNFERLKDERNQIISNYKELKEKFIELTLEKDKWAKKAGKLENENLLKQERIGQLTKTLKRPSSLLKSPSYSPSYPMTSPSSPDKVFRHLIVPGR